MDQNAVVCFSGGLDSYIMLRKAIFECKKVFAIYVDYGSKHAKQESITAADFCYALDIPIRRVEIPSHIFNSNLVEGELPVGRKFDEIASDEINPAYVPNRNMIIASLGGAFALSSFPGQPVTVCMGFHKTDGTAFVDTTPEASDAIDFCLKNCTNGLISFYSFARLRKPELIKMAVEELKVPLRELWATRSCYFGSDSTHCGECDACIVRRKAFHEAGYEDGTKYKCKPEF